MHVGVFPPWSFRRPAEAWSSPCTWGCFPERVLVLFCVIVFPMHVGVFPLVAEQEQFENGLPHARGGVSR